MEDKLTLYQGISARERASRKAAEKLLEEKSLQLYEKNERVEKAQKDLLSLNMHLTNIMASAPDGIVTCSQNLKILNLNQTAGKQFNLPVKEAIGQSISKFIPDLPQEIIQQNSKAFEIEDIPVSTAAGIKFRAEIRGRLSKRGKEIYFVLFIHDITNRIAARKEREQMHLQFDEARRLEAIGALSAGIAHEINTPIQYIGDNLGYLHETMNKVHGSYLNYAALSSAIKAHKNPEDLIEMIDKYNRDVKLNLLIGNIEESIQESLEGIDQVRDIILLMKEFAHPGGTECDEADINLLIHGVMKITNSRYKGIADIELDLSQTLPPLNCRRNQIRQVILNMVINAIDAIEETDEGSGKIRIQTRSDSQHLHIIISDTGPGIPESLVTKIFDPFFTTKPVGKGTGQGLALAKDFIIKGHQGDLKLVDIKGFGTSFQISLPLNPANTISLENKHVA